MRKRKPLHPEIEEYLALKKTSTSKIYRSALRRFTKYYKTVSGEDKTISDFLDSIFDEYKKDRREQKRIAEIVIVEFIRHLKNNGLSGNSIRLSFAALQNFLKYKGININTIFVGNLPAQLGKKVNKKHPWKIEHLKEFVQKASSYRDKALILCMFQSGLAVQEICDLNYGEVRKDLELEVLPICLELVRQKTSIPFKTFFGRDAVKYLKLYLQTRKKLKDSSPLFSKLAREERLTTNAVQQRFSEIAQELSFISKQDMEGYNPCRPHSMRSGFKSRLTGKVSDTLIEFWMGHQLQGVSDNYLNKPTEELREDYMDAERYLAIERTSREEIIEQEKLKIHISESTERKIAGLQKTVLGLQNQLGEQIAKVGEGLKKWQVEKGEIEAKIAGIMNFQRLVLEQPDEAILDFIKDVRRQLKEQRI
jgi:site-specific recombinase XerC